MERYRWDKKRDRLFGEFSFFLLLLSVLVFTGISEAGVTLSPRYNGTNIDGTREQYVYFGKYDHRLATHNGSKEGSPTPILWRVMELKDHGGGKGAILLSHYVLESMAYQGTYTGSDPYYRPSTAILANTWDGSEVQSWLNSSDVSVTVKLGATGANANIKGFLHSGYFSAAEQGLMLDYPYNRYSETESAPVTGKKIVLPSGKWEGSGPYFDTFEMGTWFASEETDANNNTRKAHFKDSSTSFTPGSSDGWYYWTRSPFASDSNGAYYVLYDGYLNDDDVGGTGAAVRPAFFLNLESLIFKSASNPLSSAGAVGSRQNPYLVYLSTITATNLTPTASVNGNKLTLAFTLPLTEYQGIFHAYADTADTTTLRGRFTIPGTTVAGIAFNGSNIVLTLAKTYTYGEADPTVAYAGSATTDGVGFVNTGIVPTTLAAFVAVTATNATPNPGGGGTAPTDPPTPQTVDALLTSINAALDQGNLTPSSLNQAAKDAITKAGIANPVEITKALAGDTSFAKKTAPTKALDGFTNLLPSFSSSVNLNASTAGNALALAYTLNMSSITGLENWASLEDNARVALLNNLNIIFAYEFASSWRALVGSGGVSTWGDALAKGIISFSGTGVTFNYAVLDATGDPFAAGNVMGIPDGAKDSKLIDPVWLMKKTPTSGQLAIRVFTVSASATPGSVVPVSVTLNKKPTELELYATTPGGVKKALTPAWSSDNLTATASFTADATGRWTVGAKAKLATGKSTELAEQSQSVAVQTSDPVDPVNSSSSGGCNSGFGLGALELLFASAVLLKKKR